MKRILVSILAASMVSMLSVASFAKVETTNANTGNLGKQSNVVAQEVLPGGFNEADYPNTTITYAPDGIPIVKANEPVNAMARAVYARTGTETMAPFYTRVNGQQVLFYVPANTPVRVLYSSYRNPRAKVYYACRIGYMNTADLVF